MARLSFHYTSYFWLQLWFQPFLICHTCPLLTLIGSHHLSMVPTESNKLQMWYLFNYFVSNGLTKHLQDRVLSLTALILKFQNNITKLNHKTNFHGCHQNKWIVRGSPECQNILRRTLEYITFCGSKYGDVVLGIQQRSKQQFIHNALIYVPK